LFQVGARSAVPTALVCLVKADCPTCKMAADSGATTTVRSSGSTTIPPDSLGAHCLKLSVYNYLHNASFRP
jgi:hypothetical protein